MSANPVIQRELMVNLHERLTEIAEPLADAFDARLRAIDPGFEVDRSREGTETLFNVLLESLRHANNVLELLPLASSIAQLHGGALAAISVHRHAVQAFDWAMRDLMLHAYTADERAAFSECTHFFIELLRRAACNTQCANTGTHMATLS